MIRRFAASLVPALFLLAVSLVDAQQAPKMYRVGVLRPDSALAVDSVSPNPTVEMFQQAMRDLGYVDGRNVRIEYRYADGRVDRLPKLAEELVRLNVDVIWGIWPSGSACYEGYQNNPHRHLQCWRPGRIRIRRQLSEAWRPHHGIFQLFA